MGSFLHSVVGIVALLAFAVAISESRGAIRWRLPVAAMALHFALALLFLKFPASAGVFGFVAGGVLALQGASEVGASFVFGYLGGAPLPFEETEVGSSLVLAFRIMPILLFISAWTALLSYWRVLPAIVQAFGWALERTLGVGGAVGVATAANVFVGMIEAPLFVRGYLAHLSRGELFAVMCAGMATIAGTMFALYSTVLAPVIPDAPGHLLTASLISMPAAIMIAYLMVPLEGPATPASAEEPFEAASSIDALTVGTQSGVQLYIGVVSMLFVFVASAALINNALGLLPDVAGAPISLERVLGVLMAPLALAIGLPWEEALTGGSLLGKKVVLNEFLAYLDLAALSDTDLSERSRLILTYALCGFANLGSLGITIGGLASLVPERRVEIIELGIKSIVGGSLATGLTGAVVGLVLLV
ncbi:MAG: nucleoside transporter C-terminal domain-containing protein [Pseudomonadota bacterium]